MDDGSLAPALLVAMPQLLDPNFRRSVVLVIHHDASGSFGLVLSRESEIDAAQLCASVGITWHGGGQPVGWGGPVQPNSGWVLVGDGAEPGSQDDLHDATHLGDGLHFAGSLTTLRHVADDPPDELRLFLGYAGWGAGQLEEELAQGAWLVAPVSRRLVFQVAPEDLWAGALRELEIDPTTLVPTSGVH